MYCNLNKSVRYKLKHYITIKDILLSLLILLNFYSLLITNNSLPKLLLLVNIYSTMLILRKKYSSHFKKANFSYSSFKIYFTNKPTRHKVHSSNLLSTLNAVQDHLSKHVGACSFRRAILIKLIVLAIFYNIPTIISVSLSL